MHNIRVYFTVGGGGGGEPGGGGGMSTEAGDGTWDTGGEN